jgi:energy-coupling factor transporter ATP-binding protein EcfA2
MQIVSFQIINCFGFKDSGEIKLTNPTNFIYILGRNSSGKSALLKSINYFSKHIIPSEQPNYENFNSQNSTPSFIAEIDLEVKPINFNKFKKDFDYFLENQGIDSTAIKSNAKLDDFIKTVEALYKDAIDELNKEKKASVYKLGDGNYYFVKTGDHDSVQPRIDEINRATEEIHKRGEKIIINGSWREVDISFNKIENLLANQLPQIYLFNQQYSLIENLPDTIENRWKTKSNNFTQKFIEFLGADKVNEILKTNDPKKRSQILTFLNDKVKSLTDRVNQNRGTIEKQDLIEIFLDISTNGLQITLYTDGKPSFYSQLSDNTKYLFAYHLHQITAKISGNILLFDEPDNGFHPSAEETLLTFLQQLSENENLIIVATHSEHLINIYNLSGVRLMTKDNDNFITVKNDYFKVGKQDFLGLQPIFDAIGYRHAKSISLKDKVILTEGISDMLYLSAFNKVLAIVEDLSIAPARGDSTMLTIIPFLISQHISFKIIIDTGDRKQTIKDDFGIDEKYFHDVPVPDAFKAITKSSGIEDLLSKNDFEKLLVEFGHQVKPNFYKITNSSYIKDRTVGKIGKRLFAELFYSKIGSKSKIDFELETIDNFTKVLEFCKNSDWFNL